MRYIIILWSAMMLTSCFAPLSEEEAQEESGNVTIRVSEVQMQPMTRAAVRDHATALSIFVYDEDGEKVAGSSSRIGDDGFGQMKAMIDVGTYTAVAVAHNATEGNATSTSIGKVTFPDNRVTDTFWGASDFEVTGTDAVSVSLSLTRCVAMLRVVLTGDVPEGASTMRLYYTGGSSTLSGTDGTGSVNSRQTVTMPIAEDGTYEVLTFPHSQAEEGEALKLTLTCLAANGDELREKVYADIPIRMGYITTLTTEYFAEGADVTISIDDVTLGWGNIAIDR